MGIVGRSSLCFWEVGNLWEMSGSNLSCFIRISNRNKSWTCSVCVYLGKMLNAKFVSMNRKSWYVLASSCTVLLRLKQQLETVNRTHKTVTFLVYECIV